MAVELPFGKFSRIAGEDLREAIYHAVKLDTDGHIVKGTAGARCVGILQDNPENGQVGSVMALGISPAVYGASVIPSDELASDANGHLVPAVAGQPVVAVAMEAGSANEEHSVLILPQASATAKEWWIFYIPLADIVNGDLITEWIPGFAGRITEILAIVEMAATTAAKAATLNAEIETTNLAGGVLALTSANCTPKGAQVVASAVTANNAFSATQKISIEASSVTAFVEGAIWLMIGYTRP